MKTTFLMCCLALAPAMAKAQVNYAVSGNTAYVTNSPNASGDVLIDSTYNGYPVTSISYEAFAYSSLTSVIIPNSVTSIENGAFGLCTNLTSVTIPNSVTSIGSAFWSCSGLTGITIPNSVTSIGGDAFSGCTSLLGITVDAANPSYSSLDGVLFDKSQSTLIQCPGGKSGSYTIPDSVSRIWDSAFNWCTSLISVIIPNGVTNIGSTFQGCASLTNVTIPSSVTSIGDNAFWDCTELTAITVDAHNPAYSSVDGVFLNKSQNTLIRCPGGKTGSYTIPNSVTDIEVGAFEGCTGLTSVTITNNVTHISNDSFAGCTSLTNVMIGKSVVDIGWEYTFGGCSSLTAITVDALNPVYSSVDGVLFDKSQTMLAVCPAGKTGTYTVPNSVTEIGWLAFNGCAGLTNVMIGNSVTSIGSEYTFGGCTSLNAITVDALNPVYSSVDGVLFDKSQTMLAVCPAGKTGTYTVPNSVTEIGWLAFNGCAGLTNVMIGNSVTSIDQYAFVDCSSLKSITFLGNAPALGVNVFINVPGTVYYYSGTGGWGATYGGLPTVKLSAPQPRLGAVSASSGNFAFTVTGVAGQTIVVEASADLAHWQSVWTNTLSASSALFTDAQGTNYHFYRAVLR